MSAIGAALLDCLGSVKRPGDFCTGGRREIFMPAIELDGVGPIALPLLAVQIAALRAAAERAPYGLGEATLVDPAVRNTWQIDPSRIRIGGRRWPETLAGLVAEAALGLGVTEPVTADFYKLLIYEAGGFFVEHRDTEKVPGMFATMVLVLPSDHRGGELIVRHLDREVTFDLHPEDPSEIGFAAFYADCVHEIRPLTSGCRLALVFNLRFPGRKQRAQPPDYRGEQHRTAEQLRAWTAAADEPDKLILPLEHAYTPAELSFATLKGRDRAVASVLVAAAAAAACDLHLALVSIEERGSAEPVFSRSGRGWRDDGAAQKFEVIEIDDSALLLSHWCRPDGEAAGLGDIPFTEDELCPPEAFAALTPDEQHFREATGNEGASFERTYRRAGLVLWPCQRRLAVLNAAGLAATLPHLEELTTRWEASGAGTGSPLWGEADALSDLMVASWPHEAWRREGNTDPARMLDLQVRLGAVARIDAFLGEVSAAGHYAAADNAAIVRAAARLNCARATDLLVRIVRSNAPTRLAACGDLLRRCAAPPAGPVGAPAQIATALLEMLPGDPARRTAPANWYAPAPVTPGFVVDLLTALSGIDAGLAARALGHLLAWPASFAPDEVLVPAALAFVGQAESRAWPAVVRLREVALDHLGRRIALPLAPPQDWARSNPLTCRCADCCDLGAFLLAPELRQWRLKAAAERRGHVANTVRNAGCDLDLKTEKLGSPHTLLAIKNQASFERRARQRRDDLAHVAALGG